jgi:hypothetical protein
VALENTYNGNSQIVITSTNTSVPVTQADFINTNVGTWFAPDGFIYFQQPGNTFIARNCITNNALEAVQLNAGPNSVVGNTFYTSVNDIASCALNGAIGHLGLPGTNSLDNSSTFIGNWVYGDRHGDLLITGTTNNELPAVITVSGNWLNLSPPLSVSDEFPGAAASIQICQTANVLGNTLVAGGHGVRFGLACSNALIMNNNFAGAAYRGIGYEYTGDSLNTAQIFGNTLSEGVSFHVQLPWPTSFGWFMGNNQCLDINSNTNSAFLDPASSAIHTFN